MHAFLPLITLSCVLGMLASTSFAQDAKNTSEPAAQAEASLEPLAHFRFDGDVKDSSGNDNQVTVANARFKDGALYVDGTYDAGEANAMTCKINTPALDYNSFTVGIRFKAYRIQQPKFRNIITGGPAYRWLSLSISDSGRLRLKLNNHEFERNTPAKLVVNEWSTVICGVDLNERTIRLYVNGKEIPAIELPQGFKFKVASSPRKEADKVWTFANYSNATRFHGLVDELAIYDGVLTVESMSRLKLPITDDQVVHGEPVKRLATNPPATLVLKGHTKPVSTLAWSADGKVIATASGDRTIRVWDATTGQQTSSLQEIARQGYGSPVVAFTGDLKTAAINYWGEITIRKVSDGKVLTTIDPILDRGQRSAFRPDVFALAFGPDGKQLVTAGSVAAVGGRHGLPGGIVIVWDAKTGKIIHKSGKLSTAASAVVWSRSGKQFAIGTNGAGGELQEAGEVHVWDASTGMILHRFSVKEETEYGEWASAGDVALSPDGKRVAVPVTAGGRGTPAGLIINQQGATVKVWDLATAAATQPFPAFASVVERVAFSPDGKRLATAGRDKVVRIWNINSGNELAALASPSGVTVVAFNPNGNLIAAGGKDGTVTIWRLEAEQDQR